MQTDNYELINLTPHAVNVVRADGRVDVIPPSGNILRLPEIREPAGELFGAPVYKKRFDRECLKLPDNAPGRLYIVSAIVKIVSCRDDFIVPDELVKDPAGRIVGTRSFWH